MYRAIREGFWAGGDPLPRDRSLLRDGAGRYPAGRWNDPDQDALYASHHPGVALTEVAGRFRPGTNARMILESQGAWPFVIVVASFEELSGVGRIRGGRLDGEDFWIPYMRLLPPDDHARSTYLPSQALATTWSTSGVSRLIVPSAPYFNLQPRAMEWNSVFFMGGRDQFTEAHLPSRSELREVLRRETS